MTKELDGISQDNTSETIALVRQLRPSNLIGFVHFFGEVSMFAVGLMLANSPHFFLWLLSQILLAFVLFHSFILLHEAGHNHLFAQRNLNTVAGHWAGLLSIIPFNSWKKIHALHHRYTGWQDLDATTQSIVPRSLNLMERGLINFAWKSFFPLFSLLYRIQNYWNWIRLKAFISSTQTRGIIAINIFFQLCFYFLLVLYVGASELLNLLGFAFLFSWVMQDIFILSQHTHIPQHVSGGEDVSVFSSAQQVQFTRSLLLPKFLSCVLMHNDRHALHHQFPSVPGYRLSSLHDTSEFQVHWWTWLKAAKKLSVTQFLFSNRNQTGFDL